MDVSYLIHMQIQQKATHIQSFGGLNFINEYLTGIGFEDIVTGALGCRSLLAQYSYADLIRQLYFIAAIGGDALDDSNTLKQQLSDHPCLRIASADTIEYAFQELRQPIHKVAGKKDALHQTNEHEGFNKLLPLLCRKTKLLTHARGYTMDYDGHIIKNTKDDNAFTYKKTEGYYPVLCSINKLPVYMQNRNGNTPESFNQKQIIEKAINECAKNGIAIKSFRADACCYQKELIEYLEGLSTPVLYTIRAEMSLGLRIALEDEDQWQPAILNYQKIETCSISYKALGKERLIVAYRKKACGQLSIEQTGGYDYHAVITNNDNAEAISVIEFYNQRGCDGEHHFKELDYDFNWNKLPFDNMEMNTIYLYAAIIGYLLFNASKQAFSHKLSFVKQEMRLKNFILHFVTLPAKWIKTARRWVLKIFTTKDYSPLWAT